MILIVLFAELLCLVTCTYLSNLCVTSHADYLISPSYNELRHEWGSVRQPRERAQ